MQPTKKQSILRVGDFVKVRVEGQETIASVKERIGDCVVLSNGIRFDIVNDRWKSTEEWIDECTRSVIKPTAVSAPPGSETYSQAPVGALNHERWLNTDINTAHVLSYALDATTWPEQAVITE